MGSIMTNPPAPGTAQWRETITASKVPAMATDKSTGEFLGVDYKSAYELYHIMRGEWEDTIDESTQAMFDDAHDAEDYAVNVWKRANPGWQTNAGEVAYTDESLPFPNLVTLDRRARRGQARKILEVKRPRVARGVRDNWLLQMTFQMGISGIHRGDLIEVPVYGEPVIHHVSFNEALYKSILLDAESFWHRLCSGDAPDAGDSEHAKEIFAALNPVDAKAAPYEVDPELMGKLLEAWDELDAAQSRARAIENQVAQAMGDAPVAVCDERKVVRRSAGRFAQSRIPAEHKKLLENPEYMTLKFDPAKLKKRKPDIHAAACGNGGYTFERKAWKES